MRPTSAIALAFTLSLAACGSRTPLLDEATVPDAGPTFDAGCSGPGVVTLVSRPQFTWFGESIAVDDTSLYWLEHGEETQGEGRLMRVSKCGGTPEQIATTANYPGRVVVDATRAYWSNQSSSDTGGVMSVPLAGGAATILQASGNATGIALDATYVYWIDHGAAVMRTPKVGGAAVTLASGQVPWDTVAVNASRIVWTNQPAMGWSLTAMPVAGGPLITLASASTGSVVTYPGLAIDDTRAYWIAYGPGYGAIGAILSVPLDPATGGAPVMLATAYPTSIAVDAANVFWTDYPNMTGAGAVKRIPKSGGAVSTLASGLADAPSDIAIDATRVYWTGATTVMSAAK
jgi:hypothetical protein